MKMMGLDYGDRRIGVAVSDDLGWTAQGVEVIDRLREGAELRANCQISGTIRCRRSRRWIT